MSRSFLPADVGEEAGSLHGGGGGMEVEEGGGHRSKARKKEMSEGATKRSCVGSPEMPCPDPPKSPRLFILV